MTTTSGPAADVEAIRARHASDSQWCDAFDGTTRQAHADRGALLALLDAARAERDAEHRMRESVDSDLHKMRTERDAERARADAAEAEMRRLSSLAADADHRLGLVCELFSVNPAAHPSNVALVREVEVQVDALHEQADAARVAERRANERLNDERSRRAAAEKRADAAERERDTYRSVSEAAQKAMHEECERAERAESDRDAAHRALSAAGAPASLVTIRDGDGPEQDATRAEHRVRWLADQRDAERARADALAASLAAERKAHQETRRRYEQQLGAAALASVGAPRPAQEEPAPSSVSLGVDPLENVRAAGRAFTPLTQHEADIDALRERALDARVAVEAALPPCPVDEAMLAQWRRGEHWTDMDGLVRPVHMRGVVVMLAWLADCEMARRGGR